MTNPDSLPAGDPGGSSPPASENLQLRRRPLQRRGQITFNRVLDAAEQILIEKGVLALTTNLIASRSGVNISSIYKFFPNKHSVILALFERHLKIRIDHVREAIDAMGTEPDWRGALDKAIGRSYEARQLTPATIVVLRAMLSSQELYEVDQAARKELALLFAGAIRQRTSIDDDHLMRIARCMVETSIALLNFWQSSDGANDPLIIVEAKRFATAYLSAYLDAD
jgi:AcrR family transcriptional regulator